MDVINLMFTLTFNFLFMCIVHCTMPRLLGIYLYHVLGILSSKSIEKKSGRWMINQWLQQTLVNDITETMQIQYSFGFILHFLFSWKLSVKCKGVSLLTISWTRLIGPCLACVSRLHVYLMYCGN